MSAASVAALRTLMAVVVVGQTVFSWVYVVADATLPLSFAIGGRLSSDTTHDGIQVSTQKQE